MQLRWLVFTLILMPPLAESAAVYTFGKRSDGSRYIKSVDSPKKEAEESSRQPAPKAPSKAAPAPLQRQPSGPVPPPIPDAQKLDLLNRPI